MPSRVEGELFLRGTTGGLEPSIGDTLLFEDGGWRFGKSSSITAAATLPAGDSDDFAVAENVSVLWVTPNAANSALTGLSLGFEGRLLRIFNVGTDLLTLKHEDVGSVAENRFKMWTGLDRVLNPDDAVTLLYDGAAERWREVEAPLQAEYIDLGAVSGAIGLDFSLAQVYRLALSGNVVLSVSGYEARKTYFIVVEQGAGAFTVTWPAEVKWPGASALVVSTGLGEIDIVSLICLNFGTPFLYGVGQQNFG